MASVAVRQRQDGKFTAPAKRLRRATSAISLAMGTLEQQLGLSLFDRAAVSVPALWISVTMASASFTPLP
ncbi:MAG: LysR family transcriptional regulator [Mesorhizobium sp.]|uniref:LysR family transcriptional regulator n=1 Tax=Mesorhizobium sp. TaxID=1871066 RepID=UPI000FE555A1|nr:MAG: LysR family transcriptional regulator [Mesorhizobium sp.]